MDATLVSRIGPRTINLTGQPFGRWTVRRFLEYSLGPNGKKAAVWECVCVCGVVRPVLGKSLTAGVSQSCGCLQKEHSSKQPGDAAKVQAWHMAMSGARRRGLAWELGKVVFFQLISLPCHYCDGSATNRRRAPNGNGDFVSNGVDRKDSLLGYVNENVVPCCKVCQRAKMDMPYLDFIAYLERLGAKYGSSAA
jgi:hypothetical protein